MPRRRWRVKGRRTPLLDALRFHLETGQYPQRGQFPTWAEVWFITLRELEVLWMEHGEEITGAWSAADPGTRPWGWWQWVAREPRICLEGAAYVWPHPGPGEWVWKMEFGLPGRPQARKPGASPARLVFESEATYLQRLALLRPGETERLTEEDFEPEAVEIPEIPARSRELGHQVADRRAARPIR